MSAALSSWWSRATRLPLLVRDLPWAPSLPHMESGAAHDDDITPREARRGGLRRFFVGALGFA
jgi:hypothetical protein